MMTERLPLLFGEDEIVRLHSLAYATAIQTGAKVNELDEVTSEVFRSLARQANRAVISAQHHPRLRLVHE
jgi:hypothetical protein